MTSENGWPISERRPGFHALCQEIRQAHPGKSAEWVQMAAKERYIAWAKDNPMKAKNW